MNRWKDGQFDCLSNCPVCLFGCCCAPIAMGQLWEKLIGPRGRCIIIAIGLWTVVVFGNWLKDHYTTCNFENDQMHAFKNQIAAHDFNDDSQDPPTLDISKSSPNPCSMDENMEMLNTLVTVVGWGISTYLVCRLRGHVRSLYSIRENSCIGMEDVCCAFWCTYPVLCQMMRHVYAYEVTGGSPWTCSATGDPPNVNLDFVHAPVVVAQAMDVGNTAPPAYEMPQHAIPIAKPL